MGYIPSLHTADWLVFWSILILTFASVAYGQWILKKQESKTQNSPLELLLMGRRLTLPLFIPTLVATWYGGIFGVTSLSFQRGVFNFVTQGAFWYATYLIFAFVLVKRVRQLKATGLADLAGQMHGMRAQKLTSILAFTNLLPIGYLSGLGIFIGLLFGIHWWWAALLGLILLFTYALSGGLRAVVFSDLVQCAVMFIAVWLIVIVCWYQYGGLNFLQSQLPTTHWDPSGGNAWGELFIWGFIALGTLVDPNFHQRIQAADSDRTARRGIIIATILWFIFDMATTLGGLYARAILPNSNPEWAYMELGLTVLPPGLKGLFLAGLLATILSTLDSYLFTAGATLATDLFGKTSKWAIKWSMVFTGVLAWAMAPLFNGSIVSVWKILGGLASASLVPAIVFSLCFPKKLDEKGFLLSVGMGIAGTVGHGVYSYYSPNMLDQFYMGLACSMVGLALGVLRKPKTY